MFSLHSSSGLAAGKLSLPAFQRLNHSGRGVNRLAIKVLRSSVALSVVVSSHN